MLNIFSGWQSIKGRFISVIGANISCACAKSPEGLSPSAHLADGCLDLILVKHTSRLQYLRHMIRLSSKADQVRDQILLTVPRTFYSISLGGISMTVRLICSGASERDAKYSSQKLWQR